MAYTNKVEAGATGQEKATREPNLWEVENLDPKDYQRTAPLPARLPSSARGLTLDGVRDLLANLDVLDDAEEDTSGSIILQSVDQPLDDPETDLFLAYSVAMQSGKL